MHNRGQRSLHPRQVARVDRDATARIPAVAADELGESSARHRRPTVRMSADEIERAVAEAGATARRRLARGSGEHEATPLPMPVARRAPELVLDLEPDPYPDPALALLPFRARRPLLATAITAALVLAFLLALHGIISAG